MTTPKRTILENYWLVFDSFGVIPVWSIQHPTKEAKEGYLILREESEETDWFKEIEVIKKMMDMLHQFYITISCEIEFMTCYHKKFEQKVITKICNVKNITLIPDNDNPLLE